MWIESFVASVSFDVVLSLALILFILLYFLSFFSSFFYKSLPQSTKRKYLSLKCTNPHNTNSFGRFFFFFIHIICYFVCILFFFICYSYFFSLCIGIERVYALLHCGYINFENYLDRWFLLNVHCSFICTAW